MKKTIWIDISNGPHVLFFKPLINFLEKDYRILLSARDFSYTKKLLKQFFPDNLSVFMTDYGLQKTKLNKIFATVWRARKLYIKYKKEPISISLSCGSREQIIASRILNIPIITSEDYEFSNMFFTRFVDYLFIPEVIPKSVFPIKDSKIIKYPGFKEDMYLFNYKPGHIDLRIDKTKIIVLFRPGDYYSHYQKSSYKIIENILLKMFLKNRKLIQLIVLPRHHEQKYYLSKYFDRAKIEYFFPEVNYFGPDLIWQSDIVIGGGGTMLREACILNIPTYSFFSGRIGHVDSYYVNNKKMSFIRDYNDVEKLKLRKCYNKQVCRNPKVFDFFVRKILSYL